MAVIARIEGIAMRETTQQIVSLERGQTTMVFKNVTAKVCTNCGEAYLDEATTTSLLSAAEVAVKAGVQVEIREFAA